MATESDTWPDLDWEELTWIPRRQAMSAASKRELASQRGSYLAAVAPAIADLIPTIAPAVVAQVEIAVDAISRLDADSSTTLLPFVGILLRTEAASSSQIERLTASSRAIAEAEIDVRDRGNAPQIVANTRAMTAAISATTLTPETLLTMHRILLEHTDPKWAGRWRREQVWIGGSDYGPLGADFVPPRESRIPAAIEDLIEFTSRTDLSVMVQSAIAHAQFETIHPFVDGNGRTGRAMLHSLLRTKGLTNNTVIPISAGLLSDTDAYFAALTAYRHGDANQIVSQISQAAVKATTNCRILITDLTKIRSEWEEQITARRGAVTWEVVDLLLRQPVINSNTLASEIGASAAGNPTRALRPLLTAGLVKESLGADRRKVWRANEVLDALDQFATRAGRRTRVTTE